MNRQIEILRIKAEYRMDLRRIDRLPIGKRWKAELRERLRRRLMQEMEVVMQ